MPPSRHLLYCKTILNLNICYHYFKCVFTPINYINYLQSLLLFQMRVHSNKLHYYEIFIMVTNIIINIHNDHKYYYEIFIMVTNLVMKYS